MKLAAAAGRAPVRVLHLRDSPWIDGPGRTILETASHLDPARIEFHIGAFVAPRDDDHPLVDTARLRGLSVFEFEDLGGLGGPVVDEVVKVIDRLDINVLHSSEFRSRLIAQRCRLRRRVHLVTTAHGWIANSAKRKVVRFVDKVLLGGSKQVILVSHAIRRLVPLWWLPAARAPILHNALVTSAYGREILERPRRPIDPAGPITLLNVGRLSPEKGQDMLIRAVQRLSGRWPGLRLRIAGIGPLEQQLRELAQSLGIGDRVQFDGYVADMPNLYFESDLIVQSSFTEGLPNVILECAFLKVPLLATAVGGTDEVVRHAHSAWLIRPDIDELTAGIERFLKDPAQFVRMAGAGHADVLENFSFEVRTQRLTRIYENLAGVA